MGISGNGYISNYLYDASGERTVKMQSAQEGVYVNGVLNTARLNDTNFTLYVSPYLVVSPGGSYTKHIYAGSQRIASHLGNGTMDAASISRVTGRTIDLKRTLLEKALKAEYDSLGAVYTAPPASFTGNGANFGNLLFFYHPDHLGSSSLITNADGAVTQHVEYVPFGEVFIEERNNTWNTPYLFNAKELDEETGLYYYGARYYDPRTGTWLSTDPLAEKFPNINSYCYTFNNPVRYIDPDGRDVWEINNQGKIVKQIKDKNQDAFYMVDEKGNRTYTTDADGNKHYNSISFEYGTITGSQKSGWFKSATSFAVDSESSGAELFKFLLITPK